MLGFCNLWEYYYKALILNWRELYSLLRMFRINCEVVLFSPDYYCFVFDCLFLYFNLYLNFVLFLFTPLN